MEIGFVQLMRDLILRGPQANLPLDVAPPPPEAAAGLTAGAIAVLFFLVLGIILVAFFVIRAIKKNQANQASKDHPR